jgi:magnesium-transporting ATPase (P-type)
MAALVCGVICSYPGKRDVSPCSDFMFHTSIGFKSKNIVRGRVEREKAISPKVKLGYQVFNGMVVYVGMDSAFGVNSKSIEIEIEIDSMFNEALNRYGQLAFRTGINGALGAMANYAANSNPDTNYNHIGAIRAAANSLYFRANHKKYLMSLVESIIFDEIAAG